MPITETDAIGLHQALSSGLLDEERQKAAALKLQGYADERKRQGLSLFPSIEKQRREQRQTFYSVIEDPKKLDAENGIYQRADAVRPGGGDNMRAEEVTARWMADKYQLPVDEVRKDWKKFAQDYGARNWNEAVVLEAPRFLARVQQEAKAEKQTVDTINTAADEAMKSALRGGDMVADWKAWEAANPEAPKGARKAWEQVQGETLKRLGPDGRAAAMRAVRALQNATGTAENADGWWNEAKRDLVAIKTANPGKYRMVLEAIKLLGSEGPKDDKGLAQGVGESFARGVEHITRGSMSSLEPFQARLADWGVTNADDPQALANQIRAGLDVDKDMLDLANGAIDPIKPDGWLESGVYMAAGSAPYMLSGFNPLGWVAMAGSFSNDAYHDLKASGWEGADAELAAVASGTIQAAVEGLSEVASKIPGVGAVMAKYGVGPGTNWLARFMVRSGVRAGAETVEEIVQQATTPIIRDIAGAILPNVPETPEGQKLKDVMGEFFKADNFVPLLISVLPLGMIGAGLRTAHDKAIVDLVTKNDSMLRAVFSEEDAAAIAAETDPAKRQAMIENKWVAMPTEEMLKRAKALDDENRKKTADAWRAITRAEQMGMIPAVRRGVDGWTVTKDGKTLKVESRQEAVELAYSGLSDYEFQSAASMAQAADEFANLGGGRAEAFEISMSQRSVQQEVDVGRVTPEQAAESVQVFAQMHGLTAEEARAETLSVLGNNKSEMVEGVRTAISRIFGGGNTITVLHEGVHGRWRMGLESGHYTPQQGLAWVRMAEEASGVDFLPTRNDGEVSAEMLDEAITEVASADIIGRRKDSKSHFTPGMISRGVASFALSQRANAKEAGKFASFLKAWKEFWGQILRNARKLKKARDEGKLGEDFDAFLDDLLGSDAQVRHEAAAAKEAADITTNIDNAPFSLASPAILGRIAEIQGDDTTAREIGLDESYHASRDRTLLVADPLIGRDTRQGKGKAGFYTAPVASETEQYQRQGSPFVHRFDIPADARVKILRRAGQVERLSPEQVSEWRNQGFDIVVGKAILGQKVEVVFLRSPANQGSMVDNAPFSLQSRAVPADTSNVYEMPDGAQLVGPTLFSITAYHGTPHKVDKFRLDKIGTGEGAQAYGHGLYFSQEKQVAEGYQSRIAGAQWVDKTGRIKTSMEIGEAVYEQARKDGYSVKDADEIRGYWSAYAQNGGMQNTPGIESIRAVVDGQGIKLKRSGNLYTVELLPDESEFLDWDKPISEQSNPKLAALRKAHRAFLADPAQRISDKGKNGDSLYHMLVRQKGSAKAASEYLASIGIPGIRYLDGNSRDGGSGTRNYVIFDENLVKILEENGRRVDNAPFSLAPRSLASVADTVLASKMRSPEFRDKFYTIAREKLSAFRRDGDWRVDKNGNASRTEGADSFADRTRTVANIERERKFRQRSRQRELIESGMSALSNETMLAYDAGLTALEDHHLISAMLNDHGRLMSWSTANEQGKVDAFSGDYDGAPTLPPKWYAKGGGIMPDVMAQYLYDDGHLAEPTTDALWSALSAAIEGVRLQNDAVKKAVSAVREVEKTALRQSKEESEAWAKAEKARIPTAKERQMKALRTLDALLSAFPPEIRGRVGGFVQLAALGTDKAREAEIERRITKLDEVVESEAKKHYGAEVAKLFERAKPKRKAGEKPKGKLGAEIHGMFDRLKAAMSMTDIEADGRADTLEAQIASGDLTPEEEAIALREAGLTRLLGNWYPRTRPTGRANVKGAPIVETFDTGADAARMGAAYEALKEVLSGAMADSVLQKRAQAEKRQAIREALIQSAGSQGDASFRDAKTIEVQGLGGWFKELSIGGLNFEQALEWAFGDSVEVRALADWERRASNQKEDAIQEAAQSVEDLFTAMAGSRYKGEKLRWALGQKNVKVGTRTLSQLEMLTATMMWMQEDGRRHMEGRLDETGNPVGPWHYSQAFVDEIEGKLSREAKTLRSFLLTRYANGWAGLDAVYSRLNGVHLPQHANYSPLTVQPQQAPAGMGIDPVTGSVTSGKSTSPGGLKSRSGKIAEPIFRDALQTFMAHTRQMEHWKAYAELVNEARSALANREVGNAVEGATNAQARTVLNNWVDFFAEGGTRDAAAYLALVRGIGKASGRAAAGILIGKIGTVAIQVTQLAAAAAKIPFTSYVKRLSKLMTGNLGWRAAMRSEYIQRRLKEMPPIVRQLMEGLAASKPNRLKYEVARIGRLISGSDALFTAGTYAILYDYHIGQAFGLGLRGAEAVAYAENEAQRATDDVAQPTRAGARSILENRSTSPFMRLAWNFASDQRKNLGLMLAAAKPGMTKPRFLRAAMFVVALNSGISWLIRSAWRDVRDGGDDELFDEDHWSAKRLALGIGTDWMGGIPIFGQLGQGGIYAIAGEYQSEGNMFSSVARSVNGWERMLSGESQDTLKDIDLILSGLAPFNDTISAASSMSHLARDLKDVSVNFVSE